MKILIINVGSTSLKSKLFDFPSEQVLSSARVEGIGQKTSEYRYSTPGREIRHGHAPFAGYSEAIRHLLADLLSPEGGGVASLEDVAAVGFKTVLAKNIVDCVVLDDSVLEAMEELAPLAPTHNPPYIAAIRSFRSLLPDTPLIGLFEPAFHKTIPEHAWRYALPYEWAERYGIRRYGFHGASHRWAAERAAEITGRRDLRLVSCHLGGSSSVNATRGTTSLDNSFGLTPQSGLIQSGRPGDIDPNIPVWMIETLGMTTAEVRRTLSVESGLVGLSGGLSGEMKDILAAARESPSGLALAATPPPYTAGETPPEQSLDGLETARRALVAAEAYVYQVRKWIGAAAVILGGVDCLLFTGGIGERSADLRGRILRDLEFLGVDLDPAANAFVKPDADVASQNSRVRVLIVEANEELVVARACVDKLKEGSDGTKA